MTGVSFLFMQLQQMCAFYMWMHFTLAIVAII